MKRYSVFGGLAVAMFALPAMAQETAYTTSPVNIEAGPADDYPSLGSFGPGTPVTLYGCLDGWTWCDVSYGDVRGWVDGEALAYPYEDQRVPIATYGPELALPIVTFSFGDYWGRHYRDRPFFAERDRFERHAPPPPPRHREAPPPLPARGHPGEGRPGEGRPGEGRADQGRPVEHEPGQHPGPGPSPAVAHPEQRPQPEARPPVPHPQPAIHPVEPRPQAAPRPEPAARPPEPHPQQAPHPQPHPGEEHREPQGGDAPHQQ